MPKKPAISFWYLFINFLSIGSTAFGGHMALIAVVQQKLCVKDKILEDHKLLELISLASFMPGPLAVNVVTSIGYLLKGWFGALLSMLAILFPSFLMMLAFAYFYSNYSEQFWFSAFLEGVMPVILALILFTAYKLGKKNLIEKYQWPIALLALVTLIIFKGFWVIILTFVLGGIVAVLIHRKELARRKRPILQLKFKLQYPLLLFTLLATLLIVIPIDYSNQNASVIGVFFGKVSLTLFGGGYVMIPILQNMLVDKLQWIETQSFLDAIAFGQITPGPILVSATFIGYKLAGFSGAFLATIGIFLPSSLLMIFVAKYYQEFQHNNTVQVLFKGIKPAVVGMIAASCFLISKGLHIDWLFVSIFLITFSLLLKFNISIFYLIVAGGILGIILNLNLYN